MNATTTAGLKIEIPAITDKILADLETAMAMRQAWFEAIALENGISLYDADAPQPYRDHCAAYRWLRTIGHQIHLAEVAAEA